jgi:3-deoxy-D-manno-octulosonate 8-phosphate phosphatase (KDO 8-P phosphatase)
MIKAIALDFDGVLTDGSFVWSTDWQNEETKRMSFRDRTGIGLARQAGLPIAIITATDSPIAYRYAMTFDCLPYLRSANKLVALQQFAELVGVQLAEIAYMGDDTNDLDAIAACGFSGCPGDAHYKVLNAVQLVMRHTGGRGAVREFIDHILTEGLTCEQD